MDDQSVPSGHLLDDLIATCVAHGLTDEATAKMVGVSARTVRRRRHDPGVAEKVGELVAKRVEAVNLRLSSLGAAALDVFEDAMSAEVEMHHRLAGAKATMANLHTFGNTAELERRVAELEGLLEQLRPLLEEETDG